MVLWSYENDPDTSFWGTAEAGTVWFNRTATVFKCWDGVAVLLVGTAAVGTSITSNPSSGQYRMKHLRLDATGKIEVVYDGTPLP